MSWYGRDSLWPIARRVRGATEAERQRRVDERDTHLYLRAGLDEVRDALSHTLIGDDTEDTDAPAGHVERLLSRRRVTARINRNPNPYGLRAGERATEGAMRYKWDQHKDYVLDVFSLVAHARQPSFRRLDDAEIEALTRGRDLASAIAGVAHRNLVEAARSWRRDLHLFAMAYAGADRDVCAALASTYRSRDPQWSEVCRKALRARGLALRPGATLEHVAVILEGLDDGLTMRMTVDPEAVIAGEARDACNRLGQAVQMLMVGCVDPGDGESLSDAVNRIGSAAP